MGGGGWGRVPWSQAHPDHRAAQGWLRLACDAELESFCVFFWLFQDDIGT